MVGRRWEVGIDYCTEHFTIKVLAVAQGDASGQKGILVKHGEFSKFAFY